MTVGKTWVFAVATLAAAGTGVLAGEALSAKLADAFIDRLGVALDSDAACGGPWIAFGQTCFAAPAQPAATKVLVAVAPSRTDAATQ